MRSWCRPPVLFAVVIILAVGGSAGAYARMQQATAREWRSAARIAPHLRDVALDARLMLREERVPLEPGEWLGEPLRVLSDWAENVLPAGRASREAWQAVGSGLEDLAGISFGLLRQRWLYFDGRLPAFDRTFLTNAAGALERLADALRRRGGWSGVQAAAVEVRTLASNYAFLKLNHAGPLPEPAVGQDEAAERARSFLEDVLALAGEEAEVDRDAPFTASRGGDRWRGIAFWTVRLKEAVVHVDERSGRPLAFMRVGPAAPAADGDEADDARPMTDRQAVERTRNLLESLGMAIPDESPVELCGGDCRERPLRVVRQSDLMPPAGARALEVTVTPVRHGVRVHTDKVTVWWDAGTGTLLGLEAYRRGTPVQLGDRLLTPGEAAERLSQDHQGLVQGRAVPEPHLAMIWSDATGEPVPAWAFAFTRAGPDDRRPVWVFLNARNGTVEHVE